MKRTLDRDPGRIEENRLRLGRHRLLGIRIRITKYRANCRKCGTELTIYPRHVEHHEPIVCPSCGRRNSADEFDLRDQIATEQRELRKLFRRKD